VPGATRTPDSATEQILTAFRPIEAGFAAKKVRCKRDANPEMLWPVL